MSIVAFFIMLEFLPTYLLGLVIIFVLYLWYQDKQQMASERQQFAKERKDLYDRIMSGTITTYKENATPDVENEQPEENPDLIDLNDAKEELING